MSFMAEDLAQLLKREGSAAQSSQDGSAPTAEERRQKRTELLSPILAFFQEAWAQRSADMSLIAEKLGDGARDVAWRAPFGDSGTLEFFLGILASGEATQALQVQIYRVIGNSCADTDENRSRIVNGDHLAMIIDHLELPHLVPVCVPVLYNIMVDYEPAQLLASQSHLNKHLTKILSSPDVSDYAVFVPYICKIMALLITQDCEPTLADPETAVILLTLALAQPASDDMDDFTTLVSVALSYLASEAFQASMLTEPHMNLFLSTLHHAHTHFDLTKVEAEDQDSAELFKKLRTSLLVSLADLTGRDEFASLHHPSNQQTEVLATLFSWLRSGNPQLQAAACLALGNVSRSDEASVSLVQALAHEPLVKILSDPSISDAQLLHSALSFLKNLAVSAQNKPLLCGLLEPSCLPRILDLDTSPQVQFSAVSLTRLLLVNCPVNAAAICGPSGNEGAADGVESIVALYKRSDAEPTRLEAARAIAAICRVLHTPGSASETPDREKFYDEHSQVTGPLSFLVTQAKWPILRSEAWFVFALMCRSREGANAVAQVLAIEGVKEVLYRAITGRDMVAVDEDAQEADVKQEEVNKSTGDAQVSALMGGLELEPKQVDPKQKESMARVDRENALVMCTEMLRTLGEAGEAHGLSPLLRDLVKEGAEIVATQRS